jgi:uncharacterized membrane protein YccC
MREKWKKIIQRLARLAGGVLALVLFRWTPATGEGILLFAVLFAALVVIIILSSPKHTGFWPNKPDHH